MADWKERIQRVGVIPARYDSSRFPGKVLANIAGKPMIQRVYEGARQAKTLQEVIIATDDDRVKEVVEEFGGTAIMTSKHHGSGTDRIAEVASHKDADIFVNIQGDEPLISAKAIDSLVEPVLHGNDVQMTTLCRPATNAEEIFNVNTARVVFDQNHDALYFSRAPIPYNRDTESKEAWLDDGPYFQHIGIYAYRKEFLLRLAGMPQGRMEKIEKLEQLRALEAGFRIRVVESDYCPICVDVPADIEKVEKLIAQTETIHV